MSHRDNKVGGSSTPFGFFIGIGAGDLGSRVILNEDLAWLYGVKTKRLNEQFRRNSDRFLEDFVFG
jgi:hypothetical protein